MKKIDKYGNKLLCTLFILIPLVFIILFVFRVDDNQTLIGDFSAVEYPVVDKNEIFNGKYQNQWENWFSENFPFRKSLTKTYNQLKYNIFHELNGDWMIGKDYYLFSKSQSADFCKGSKNFTYDQYDDYAKQIAKIQEALMEQGKSFVYLINPVKAQIYYDYLPNQYQYLGNKYSNSIDSDYAQLKEALKRHKVIYYDTTEDLKALREKSEYPIYCKTGQHWNIYSCSLIMNKFFAFLKNEYEITLPTINIDSINENTIDPVDQDIYSLANLWNGNKEKMYFTTNRSYENKSDKSLFLFGTSFGEEIFSALNVDGNNKAFNKMVYWEYLTRRRENSNENMQDYSNISQDTDISDLPLLNDIEESDIVIFEQNSVLGVMEPHKKMVNYLYDNLVKDNISLGEKILANDKNKYIFKEGWHEREDWGRWSGDKECSLEFRLKDTSKHNFKLDAELVTYGKKRTVKVYVNGKYIKQIEVLPQSKHYYIIIPYKYLAEGKLEVKFESLEDVLTPNGVTDTSWKIGLGAISFKLYYNEK